MKLETMIELHQKVGMGEDVPETLLQRLDEYERRQREFKKGKLMQHEWLGSGSSWNASDMKQ